MKDGREPGAGARPITRLAAVLMLATDLGFVAYWLVTASHVLPAEWLFKDYQDPIIQAWNWSFLPLDLAVSATGLLAVTASRAGRPRAATLAVLSLGLTSASGLMAISFWVLRRDFDPSWWAPNLFLLVYPLFFIPRLVGLAGRASYIDSQ